MNKLLFIFLMICAALYKTAAQIPVVGGWSQFVPSGDSRLIYVSDVSGNDATALHYLPSSLQIGSDPFLPTGAIMAYKTITAAKAQLRNGFPDWILFKNGETWTNQRFGVITLFGRNAEEPMLIGAYGACTSRPNILTGNESFIDFAGTSASFTAIAGIHALPHTYTGTGEPVAVRLIAAPFNSVLLEDCFFEQYSMHIACHDPLLGYNTTRQNLKVRRCILTDAYKIGGGGGMFIANIDGILFEDNLIDHNGWNENVAGADPNAFSHNTYFQVSNTNLVFQNNIVARASATGGGFRCGGTILNNLFLSNPKGIQLGTHETVNGSGGGLNWPTEFKSGEVSQNVVLDSRMEVFEPGTGIQIQRVKNTAIHHNIVAHFSPVSTYNTGILLNETDNIDVHQNIVYNWGNNQTGGNTYSAGLTCGAGMIGTNSIHLNDLQINNVRGSCVNQNVAFAQTAFQNNRYFNVLTGGAWYEQWFQPLGNYTNWLAASGETGSTNIPVTYPDPSRSVSSYLSNIGASGELADFLEYCKENSRCNWDDLYTAGAVNDYIREGFDLPVSLTVVLLHLEAQYAEKAVQLHWVTENTTSLKTFHIERSSNGVDWEIIGSHAQKLPSNHTQHYVFTDRSPLTNNYYRLKMEEKEGNVSYSGIVKAFLQDQASLLVFPNPATDEITIVPKNCEVQHLCIRNSTGKIVLQVGEQGNYVISIGQLPAGLYMVESLSAGFTMQKVWIKL